jgi:hypothetical protein
LRTATREHPNAFGAPKTRYLRKERAALPLRPAGELVAPRPARRAAATAPSEAPATISVKLELAYADLAGVTPEDLAGMEERMDAIRLKQILGQSLTEQELMCLQIEQNGFGCRACLNEPPPPSLDAGSSSD